MSKKGTDQQKMLAGQSFTAENLIVKTTPGHRKPPLA